MDWQRKRFSLAPLRPITMNNGDKRQIISQKFGVDRISNLYKIRLFYQTQRGEGGLGEEFLFFH